MISKRRSKEGRRAVVIYSMHDREHHFRRAREWGASGYLTKRLRTDTEVDKAVRRCIEACPYGFIFDKLTWQLDLE